MSSLNELIQTMGNLQTDAQANLPVTPNNGNPAGANNMPVQQEQRPVTNHYPWLAPSVHMSNLRNRLAMQRNPQPALQQPAPPVMQQPVAPQPVLPMRRQQLLLPMGR